MLWSLALRLLFGFREVPGRADSAENFNWRNVVAIVEDGDWRPVKGYYAFLSYAPQAALVLGLDALAGRIESIPPLVEDGSPTRFGVLFVRVVQAIYGTMLVGVVFLLGRRLSGNAAGLIAAALASSTWLYVWAGAWFKPDALAALATGLAALWAARAIERPTRRRLLLAGVGVGLAASAKLTAALAMLPLTVAGPFVARSSARRWRDLALAAVASLVTYFATSPFWRLNILATHGVLESYEWKAVRADTTYLGAFGEAYGGLLASLHGPLVAALFWLGIAALITPPAARAIEPGRRLVLRALAAAVLLWGPALLVLRGSPRIHANNFFPTLPLATVIASVTAIEAGRRLAASSRLARHPAAVTLAVAVLVVPAIVRGSRWIHDRAVPTTLDVAQGSLAARLSRLAPAEAPRVVVYERLVESVVAWDGREAHKPGTFAAVAVDSLAAAPSEQLQRADVEIFPEPRLLGPDRPLYLARWRAAPHVEVIRPRLLRSRGPPVVVLLHPWLAEGPLLLAPTGAGGDRTGYELPDDVDHADAVSIVVRVASRRTRVESARLDGQELPLHRAWNSPFRRGLMHSERLPAGRGASLDLAIEGSRKLTTVEIWRWREADSR